MLFQHEFDINSNSVRKGRIRDSLELEAPPLMHSATSIVVGLRSDGTLTYLNLTTTNVIDCMNT